MEESEEGSPWAPSGDQAPAQCVRVCISVRMIEGLRLEATFHFAPLLFFVFVISSPRGKRHRDEEEVKGFPRSRQTNKRSRRPANAGEKPTLGNHQSGRTHPCGKEPAGNV